MNFRIFFIVCLLILSSCEKDDICLEGTPATPRLIVVFRDYQDTAVKKSVENLKVPFLVVHGSNDTSVLPIEGENLYSWNKKNKIERIKDADHVFSSSHPWQSKTLPIELKKVIYLSIDFLNSN